jgi:hypothetical protein
MALTAPRAEFNVEFAGDGERYWNFSDKETERTTVRSSSSGGGGGSRWLRWRRRQAKAEEDRHTMRNMVDEDLNAMNNESEAAVSAGLEWAGDADWYTTSSQSGVAAEAAGVDWRGDGYQYRGDGYRYAMSKQSGRAMQVDPFKPTLKA